MARILSWNISGFVLLVKKKGNLKDKTDMRGVHIVLSLGK
jgi:hypothetical protein